jgi:hypothetical protein
MSLRPEDCERLFGSHRANSPLAWIERREQRNMHQSFWTWNGRYVGYRLSDGLFGCDGRQLGYFAEGKRCTAARGSTWERYAVAIVSSPISTKKLGPVAR